MPIIPNVLSMEKPSATDSMNSAGFNNLNFYGGNGVVVEVKTDSGKTIGEEAASGDLVNIKLGEQS